MGINIALPDLSFRRRRITVSAGQPASLMHDRRRHTMKTLITALALAAIIAAPSFTQPAAAAAIARKATADAAAHKAGRDVCQSGQNDKCYWRGDPPWQGDSSQWATKLNN